MSETTTELQEQIFQEPLQGPELEAVTTLVNRHKANAALTQQLALDASRLITSSQERLKKQSGAGFLKRFASSLSGKTSENQLLNQTDTLQMQKYAWHYLKQLQQQNLINAQSIAVIRNNLGTMNDYIIETRDFLETAIDRINSRLRTVENSASFHSWSLNIEANKRRFKSIPGNLLILHLTYDFLRAHRDIELTERDVNHLVVTLEKLGVNCDDEVELLGFIIELIDQIEVFGIDRYRSMIELAVNENHVLDSHFIQKNISGLGFNALYFLSEEYEKIIDLTDDELCNSDAAREKIISRFFGNEFGGLYTNYGIRDLIGEVIGGSLVALDIYKEQNGFNISADASMDEEQPETLSLTSDLPDIKAHSFLDKADDEARRTYLRLFALCFDNAASLSGAGQEFIGQLAEHSGCPEVVSQILGIADNPLKEREHLPALQTLLNDDDKAYTWLIDAFFLLTLCQKRVENPRILRILTALKPSNFKESLSLVLVLLNESDEAALVKAAVGLAKLTQGWKNIVRYRLLRFEQSWIATEKQLYAASIDASNMTMDLMTATSKASDWSSFMGSFDDGFLGKMATAAGSAAYTIGRKSVLSSLNDMRRKAQDFIATNAPALSSANQVIAQWGLPRIDFDNEISWSDYDLDNSAENDDWYHQLYDCERHIDRTLTAFSSACSDADDQLSYFRKGDFDSSVVLARVRKQEEWEQQKLREALEKQSVTFDHDGKQHLFAIDWHDMETPPCDPEEIRHIKTDGKVWLIVDNDEQFYRSEDGENWQAVKPNVDDERIWIRRLDVIDGTWVLTVGSEAFYYSRDALTWERSQYPDVSDNYAFSATEDLVLFNGQWLWRFTERAEFEYTDKGFLFDSTKTSNYDKPLFFCAEGPGAAWERWEGRLNLSEGEEVEYLRAIPGTACLLAFCKYRSFYTMVKKKTNTSSSVMYYVQGKGWRNCTWPEDDLSFHDPVVIAMGGTLMCFSWSNLLTSQKGYDWKRQSDALNIETCYHLKDLSLFPSRNNHQRIHVSHDGQAFKEIMLEDGSWKYFAANDQGALCVYAPDSHETYLRVGTFVRQIK
ncbi:hypothetical protein [Pseudomonas sp. PH1b]|uniref:hypothetical protein n=1 Tax=Pseudomonas sp. PH1b TaxID=1397282 RepID=UPI0004680EA6|nr:hypothetical protein [Pseudomonas sp. PH1b]